ncbi:MULTISPECIES: hypothetical protein [Polymorphospora]|uniref:Uncharacterized protein n=1 Tax=Polymorphospora lycopeni TaxID=3140240 RepID=A0ABV5D273_9ACTN
MSAAPGHRARLAGGLLAWYGVLGGAVAWAVHLFVGWGVDELTCAAGIHRVAGLPPRAVIGLAVVVPALVTVGALLAAVLTWRRTGRPARAGGDPRFARARMLALLGIWGNLLFLAIIVLGGIAVLVLPSCH